MKWVAGWTSRDRLLKSASHPVDDSSSVAEWGWSSRRDTYEKLIEQYIADLKV